MKIVSRIQDDLISIMRPLNEREFNTSLPWKKPLLNPQAREKVNKIEVWLRQQEALKDPEQNRQFKTGYTVLLFGKSEAGKTLEVALLAKKFNLPVYRIDLSQIVSKYLNETEKILNEVFKRAESENSILILDEAEALFGKRTDVKDAHDRYANIEISYLLQQIEKFKGLLILNSGMRNNIDEAFIRRLSNIIHFPKNYKIE